MSKSLSYSKKEEIFNAVTHGIGACLSVAALIILTVLASMKGTVWHVVSFSIFGAMLVTLYLVSTLYHSFRSKKLKRLFRKFDHMSIFLLIAGTYTPFCLAALDGYLGWTIFGVVWGCTILGIVLKALYTGKKEILSTIMYIALGWIVIFAIKPLYLTIPSLSFAFLIAGGIFYTLGTIFFSYDKIKYNHGIWHLFVMAGSIFHFFAVLALL